MLEDTNEFIMDRINALREELINRVADAYMLQLQTMASEQGHSELVMTYQEVVNTVQRIHDNLRAAVTLDWGLIQADYAWAARVLSRRGVTWEHQRVFIDIYFDEVRQIHTWSPGEYEALEQIAQHMYRLGMEAYGQEAVLTE